MKVVDKLKNFLMKLTDTIILIKNDSFFRNVIQTTSCLKQILQAADDGAYYDLGVQQNEYFNYTDGTGLYVHYQSASKQR